MSNENTIIEDAIFVSPAILRGHPIPTKAICRAKEVPSWLSYFKNMNIGLAPGRTHNLPLPSQVLYWLCSSYRWMYNQSINNLLNLTFEDILGYTDNKDHEVDDHDALIS